MSNLMNREWLLLGIALNQFITVELFFHWFRLVVEMTALFMVSSYCLATFPISGFDRFINRQGVLDLKFSL